ncbi:hypothetical protein Agub_g13919 [Astrephomene gubernaculifera]|uniref:Uncharacterized protein n=1 Tax=Astrephomene gubernaculifera TaxID=47775 RepID=A0AAD3E2P4_9CHLO|nr:hypothetical protein Agub_g13919 [Astrephomene gubernaculifera]
MSSADPRTHYQGREIQLYDTGANPVFDGSSSYKQDYPAHAINPRQPVSPGQRQYQGNNVPFEGNSSYKQDYPAHQLEPRPPASGGQYQPNPAPFDGSTAYRDTYRPHAIDPSLYQRSGGGTNRPYNTGTAPFEGNSSYKQDFPQHPIEPRQQHATSQYQANNAPFDGTSHYKSDYQAYQLEPRAPAGPPPAPYNPAPFEGQTHYRDDFRAPPLEPRPPPPAAAYQPNAAPFQGSTETRDQYQPWPLDPANTQRRTGPPPMLPSVPFDASSTYKQQFRGWRLPPRRPALGVQLRGDRAYTLIPAEAPLPAVGKQVFTTVHDNQTEICVLVLRGDAPVASRNSVIGQFDLTGLPPGPRGAARVEINLTLSPDNVLSATATDLDAQRQEQWLRQGSMVARKHSDEVTAV